MKTGMVVNKEHISRMYTFHVRILLISGQHKCARLCDGHCLGFVWCHTNAQHEGDENGGRETLLLEMEYFCNVYLCCS